MSTTPAIKSQSFVDRISNVIFDGGWLVRFDYNLEVAGEVDEEEYLIKINPILGDRLLTFIHECLHIIHPFWDDDRIEDEAIRRTKRLKVDQQISLLSLMYERRER